MNIAEYIENIHLRYLQGNATEHTFRGDLQQLLENLLPGIRATNEPKRQKCGAPDYILTKKEIPVGFIEAKDLGDKDLAGEKKAGNKEQFDRYKAALDNVVFTDYIRFYFYKDGQCTAKISIAALSEKGIRPMPENFDAFAFMLKDFCSSAGQTISNPYKLAEMMANKAKLLAEVIEKSLLSDVESRENSTLKDQMEAFRSILIRDITPKAFADVYAQTIAYGMFAARFHDTDLAVFNRQKAADLIPKSNPFLRKLFQYIAGYDLDDRIKWIVDSLADLFLACNVSELLQGYGKETGQEDPIIHFYETFLAEYDPALRKARGVWYTPQPVVNFIVRAVDELLKTEFDLPMGIADNSKTDGHVKPQGTAVLPVHKVQILDPAAGTGTFLAETVKQIYQRFKGQKGIWPGYVEHHLIPRLNGFELLMASYAMAHLQLEMLLKETGAEMSGDQRFRVFLTNSLEESNTRLETGFANWLSIEANEASKVKRDTPVMVVMGNPPYSGESSNKGAWITGLMEDYKKEPGGKQKLNERNPKWVNDDYVKFLRMGQHLIEKNGAGILAFINPHGYLDNPTFRGMRWSLLKTYDKVYAIDLHGNSKKKETAPDGSPDVNVFDIQQGVSINIFIKTGKKKNDDLGQVYHFDLFGKRKTKYGFLLQNSLKTVPFAELRNQAPMYFFTPKNFDDKDVYENGFSVNELFVTSSVGIVTARDSFCIHQTKEDTEKTIQKFLQMGDEEARAKFRLGKDVRDWQVKFARTDLQTHYPNKGKLVKISYRPFDDKWTFYTGKSKGFHCYPRAEVMQHFLNGDNIGLAMTRTIEGSRGFADVFLFNKITQHHCLSIKEVNSIAPLYLYPNHKTEKKQTSEIGLVKEDGTAYGLIRQPNLNTQILAKIAAGLNLRFTPEKTGEDGTFSPVDLLDYIYAVLHSPRYRETYSEFLKIDFPRLPYPGDAAEFWRLAGKGGKLRALHLLESPELENFITEYPEAGDNTVKKAVYKDKRVYINDMQYFGNVPEEVWEFYVGGYQPAQKWLKDRQGMLLDFDDVAHYQRMIVALQQTAQTMAEIDAM